MSAELWKYVFSDLLWAAIAGLEVFSSFIPYRAPNLLQSCKPSPERVDTGLCPRLVPKSLGRS
ncbi:hypothetical protein PISMIDRAFT_682856 [Pisolithus microcarpus 441]|uniref:Unplaced genomic scaffold scaffold_96, whole genome shotgun sequence n=1 Tax=Pisolithus microcarpus 441 TaxID=765257 RepID=A0A0C9Y4Q3_9AGAM|nr:hypothetical protein PISMIDRAFT_682856 [Pisolithus microcarpus 441]